MKVDFIMYITSNCLVLLKMITNLCSPGIFTVEMCAKIFAMGFICHENSYLRYCHLSMLVCSIRIVSQGKLQLVLILAIMSLGRVITIFLKLFRTFIVIFSSIYCFELIRSLFSTIINETIESFQLLCNRVISCF